MTNKSGSWSPKFTVAWYLAVPLLLIAVPLAGPAQGATVPSAFADLYTMVGQKLDAFNSQLNGLGAGANNTAFAGALPNAGSNNGPQVLQIGYQIQLTALKAMGAQAVMVHVSFPMLYEPFFNSQAQYQQYVNFYQQVAITIRAMGMKVIVENDTLPSDPGQDPWNTKPFYASLNWTQYQQARAQAAATIAQTMHPDYLGVVEEPDTEAIHSGQSQVNTPAGSAAMLAQILSSVANAGVPNMLVGAGVGTWQVSYLDFIKAYVKLPVDFIDIHVYPVNKTYLPNALEIAKTAQAAGKPVAISECWVNKVRDNELGVLSAIQVEARDPFSFWAPLDAKFLQTMQNFAGHTQMVFLNFFEPQYFWAYLDYSKVRSLSPSAVLNMQASADGSANLKGSITSTGRDFYNLNLVSPDVTPPTPPSNLDGLPGGSGKAIMTWTASVDNVGVAGYYLERDGTRVATTALTNFSDKGLKHGQTYSYDIKAFDLGGNVSAASQTVKIKIQ